MVIYSPLGIQILDAPVTKEAIIKYALMGDYYIELPFNQLQYIQIPQGSYILYKGRKFEIMATVYPEFDNKTGGYKYTLKFEAQQNHMKRFVCFWLGGDNPEAVFHNTTDLESFGALIVANMNKHLGVETWSVGTIDVENPKATKLVSFNGDKCWDILNTIAETFEVEWWTEENGDLVSLNFGKLERGTPEEFKRGDVVKSIPAKKGDDSSYGTRFYVFGSTRNLTSDYGQAPQGGETNHVSEIRLRLPNGQRYIDAIPNLDKSAIVEQVVFFDDIYPKNTETITSIETVDREIIEGQTDKAYVMYCKDTPFLPSDMIEGETLGATFTSGSLMGRDFELSINYKPETWKPEDGFDKKFEIIAQVETSGESQLIVPNESLHPEPGDTFVLTGVKLPQQRIEEAEEELLKAGQAYAAKNSSDTDVYTCETNPVYCTVNDKNYNAGQAVLLVDPRFGLDGRLSRIQGYEKKLYNEYIATYTIGDNTPYSRIGSIESDVKATLYSQRIGVTDSGAAIYLITRYDSTAAEDYNAYSAKRALWQFANKQFPDTFKGKMTFEDGAQFGDFATGITGIGGLIDKKGNAEMQSLKLRGFLEVPELRYNRVDITMGDTWFAPSAGIIESVDTEAKTITLKLEEGEIGSPRVGDICMGIFHSSESSDNATEDYDDSKGNRRFAGFATCYFRITEELGTTTYKTFKYQLRPVSAAYTKQYHPAPSMTFVGYGSFSNEARQTSRYETRTYQRYLKGVSDWEFISSNIAAQYGDLSNLSVFGIDMKGYSAYLNNIYMSGVIHQFTPGGEEIPTINDRGKWLASETYNKNDEVYHNNAKWRCLVDGTKSEPSTSSEAWVLLMHVPLSSVVPVYKQQNEKPALPTGSTVPPDGWSLEYPEGGDSGASTDVTNIIIDADNEGDVTQDGVFYKLAGKGNNSTVSCKIQFDAISPGATLVLDITAYSEKGYDKLAVGKINVQNVNTADSDTYEAEVSENGVSTTVVVTAPSAGRHFVNVVYSKDSSGDANGDYGLFRIAYNTSKTIPLWVSFGSVIDGVVQSWSDPVRISGEQGKPGDKGDPGYQGCIIRLTEWVSGVEYRNDADLESDSLRYIDIVTVYENNRQLKFQCRQTHTSSNSNKPSGGTTSTYWQQLNDMVPIYTPLLFAENAVINFLQGMEFVVHNSKTDISENTIIAGLVGGDIPLFVGSNTPDNAPFRVAKDGSFTATKANIIGRIEATSGKIGNFTIDNDYWLQSSLSPSSGKDCSLFMSAARITLENIDDNYKNTFDVSAYPTSTMGAVNHSVLTVNTNRKSSQDINYYNIGIDISAEGSFGTNPLNPRTKCGNHALYLRKGDVCGLRLYNRKISSNVTLDDMDCFVTVDSDGGKRTITLPYNPQDGQLYYIRNIGTKGVQLNGNGKQIAIHTQGAWVYSDSWTDRESRNLIYCTSVGCWVMFK